MTDIEYCILRDLVALEESGERATTANLEWFHGWASKRVGYHLRSLERRGLVEVAGRVHGGARRWQPAARVRDLISA